MTISTPDYPTIHDEVHSLRKFTLLPYTLKDYWIVAAMLMSSLYALMSPIWCDFHIWTYQGWVSSSFWSKSHHCLAHDTFIKNCILFEIPKIGQLIKYTITLCCLTLLMTWYSFTNIKIMECPFYWFYIIYFTQSTYGTWPLSTLRAYLLLVNLPIWVRSVMENF